MIDIRMMFMFGKIMGYLNDEIHAFRLNTPDIERETKLIENEHTALCGTAETIARHNAIHHINVNNMKYDITEGRFGS